MPPMYWAETKMLPLSLLLKKIKEAFLKEYVTPNGRLVSGTQTAYVLALNFDYASGITSGTGSGDAWQKI